MFFCILFSDQSLYAQNVEMMKKCKARILELQKEELRFDELVQKNQSELANVELIEETLAEEKSKILVRVEEIEKVLDEHAVKKKVLCDAASQLLSKKRSTKNHAAALRKRIVYLTKKNLKLRG